MAGMKLHTFTFFLFIFFFSFLSKPPLLLVHGRLQAAVVKDHGNVTHKQYASPTWHRSKYGAGQIIAVIDTGIKADHASFTDRGMPPPPARWNGSCYWVRPMCNNKIIGAVGYLDGRIISPEDDHGHGTHIASTAAGNFVDASKVLRRARGTLSGVAPKAHLAIYKILDNNLVGFPSDVLKAIGRAVGDGADVLSMSFFPTTSPSLWDNVLATGSYFAIKAGVVPVAAAGNYGPSPGIIKNDSPWILTVGASNTDDEWRIIRYFNSSQNATGAIIFPGAKFALSPSASVANFSSRGPSQTNGNIIKPDVVAPGVNVLAAWHSKVGADADRLANPNAFDFGSGTSVAVPHVAGVVAMLRSNHPDWSPAAIKSAIMTTAYAVDRDGNPIGDESKPPGTAASVFAVGSGHVDPVAANDPGLVYDLHYNDYIPYLCGMNYTDHQASAIAWTHVKCRYVAAISPAQLNYPSISVLLGANGQEKVTLRRTVTNVGEAEAEYRIELKEPEGVRVAVVPSTLRFSRVGEKKSFQVNLSIKTGNSNSGQVGGVSEGQMAWVSTSGKYRVRSPIAVTYT